ncbi:insulinase family protein [archaeon]|nr:MAG: insulinase family protein [archaeon]
MSVSSASPSPPLPATPAIRTGCLANGLRWVAAPALYPPGRCGVWAQLSVGSLHEVPGEEGLAHVLEHAVWTGTRSYPTPAVLRATLADWGMSYGGDSNAYTDYGVTVYTLDAPDGGAAQPTLPALLNLCSELLFFAKLDDEEAIAQEVVAVLSEAQMRNTTDYRVELATIAQIHDGTFIGSTVFTRGVLCRAHSIIYCLLPAMHAFESVPGLCTFPSSQPQKTFCRSACPSA